MIVKKYIEWENIFLDTSIIISLFRSLRDDKDDVCNFINKVLTDLSTKKSKAQKERTFYISSITISEILENTKNETKASKIVKALNSDNVIFLPFDNDVAEFTVKNYHALLGKAAQLKYAKGISWPSHGIDVAREWINKDLMLIATANYWQCDTILTIDKRTMHPIAEKVNYFCSLCYTENFELSESGKNIFNYNKPKIAKKK